MAIKNFFNSISDSLNSKFLKHIILNLDKELVKEQNDIIYSCVSGNLEVIIPDNPIEDIDEFNSILQILEKFDKNDFFKSLPVRIKAFSNKKQSIIGYTYDIDYQIRNKLSLIPNEVSDFAYVIKLLEFVMYLTANNISLAQCGMDDFLLTNEDVYSNNKYYFYFPHKLEIVKELDSMCNIEWFLKIIAPTFNIRFNYRYECFFDKYFFSNNLYEIYHDVFLEGKRLNLEEIYNVLINEIQNIEYDGFYFYNSKKYFCLPRINNINDETYSKKYSFYKEFNKLFDRDELINDNIIYQNEHYIILKLEKGYFLQEYFLIYKEYNENALTSLKAIAECLEKNQIIFGAKYLVYSFKYDHPVGFAINNSVIEIYKNKRALKNLDYPNEKYLIPIIKLIFDNLNTLFFEGDCTFNKLDLEDIFYLCYSTAPFGRIQDKQSITFTNICDIKKRNEEDDIETLKVKIVLDILNEITSYTIVEKKVVFAKSQKILAFSPTVIEMYKEYLLTGNITNTSKFLEGVNNTISNYVEGDRVCYYKGYGFNPYNVKIKFKDEFCINEDEEIIPISSKYSSEKYLCKIRDGLKSVKDTGIEIINKDYYELVYDRSIDKKNDVYNLCGVLCKKYDKLLYKLSDAKSLYYNGIISNKQILEIIMKIQKLSNCRINIEKLYFSEELQICIPVNNFIYNLLNNTLFSKKYIIDQVQDDFKEILVKLDYNEDFEITLDTINTLNTKCSKHNFWYNDKECCSICYPNSIVVHEKDLGDALRKTDKYNQYTLLIKNEKYIINFINNEEKDIELQHLDELIKQKDSFNSKSKALFNLFSFKKVLKEETMQFVGYAIKSIFPMNKYSNKQLLECVYNFISLLKEMEFYGITIDGNNIPEAIGFDKYCKPVIKDIIYIKKSSISVSKSSAILSFISCILYSCNLHNNENVKNILQFIELGDFDKAIAFVSDIIEGLDGYCKKHNHYFSLRNHECCSYCWGANAKVYSLEHVEKCEVFSNIGKEAVVYDLGDGMLGKVYRTNEKGEFENELDIDKKERLIKSLIAKEDLNNSINQGKNFEIVNVKGIIIDKHRNFRGIVIEKKLNAKSIKILTDKAQLNKYNITREDVFKMLISIGYAIEFCHENNIYIGDLSYNNILFELDTKVIYIIDIDSVSLKRNKNTVFTDAFVDPLAISKEGYAKTSFEADWYAFSILCFYVLTLLHPFNGVYRDENQKLMPMPKRKVKKISVLGKHNIKIPPIALDWNEFMSDGLKSSFLDIFEKEKRYNITRELEANYKKLFGKEEVSNVKEVIDIEEEKANINQDNDVIEEVKTKSKKITSLNLITRLIAKTDKDNEHLIAKDIIVNGNLLFNGSNIFEFDHPVENVYVCNKDLIYVKTNKLLYFCYKNIQCNCSDFCGNDSFMGSSFLPIHYSKEILGVTLMNRLVSIKASKTGPKEMLIKKFEQLPDIVLSINSRYGNNNPEEISACYLETLNFLDNQKFTFGGRYYVCVDLIMNKWLIISDKIAYVFDPKAIKSKKLNIPYDKLQDVVMKNIIFFNNAIYYPLDGKICSLNLFNLNYLEFKCDKVSKNSRIEIISDGFRIFNSKNIYDLVKE